MKVFGKNSLKEALNNPSKIKKVYLSENFKDKDILKLIRDNNIRYESISSYDLDKIDSKNQGVMVLLDDFVYTDLNDVLDEKVIIMLDHLEDPHNFGAIIRTAESAGIKTIIIPKDRSVDVNPTVMKTSSGALNYINIVRVTNLNNVINKLKDNGYFIYGADMSGTDYKKINYADKVVLVIGNEGHGLSNIVRKSCDEIVSLPMKGNINSLNASVAAGILIYDLISKE